jgi:hypothetical protein
MTKRDQSREQENQEKLLKMSRRLEQINNNRLLKYLTRKIGVYQLWNDELVGISNLKCQNEIAGRLKFVEEQESTAVQGHLKHIVFEGLILHGSFHFLGWQFMLLLFVTYVFLIKIFL